MNTTKADEIALILENAIVAGELPPGTILRQEQLAEEIGVSRTPVREALRQLAAIGLVSLEANRAARVRTPSREEFRESFRIRAELEGLAAELALPNMTAAVLKRLETAEREFAKLTETLRSRGGSDIEMRWLTTEWLRTNSVFHDVFLEAASAPLLARMTRSVRGVFHGHMLWSPSPAVDAFYDESLERHTAIREAFAAGHPEVKALAAQHVRDSGALLEVVLNQTHRSRTSLLGRLIDVKTVTSAG